MRKEVIKKVEKWFAVLIILLIFILFAVMIYLRNTVYELNYFKVLGLDTDFTYEELVKKHGEPVKRDKYNYFFDGFMVHATEQNGKLHLGYVTVTDSKYRFGKYKIGVGSSLEEVKRAYDSVKGVAGNRGDEIINSDNSRNYIDGIYLKNTHWITSNYWITYDFNANNQVVEVKVQIGGP